MKNKVTIIGGGPAGLGCAYYAHQKKIDYVLYEASDSFGGNCRTIKYNDFLFDTGAHRLHDKNESCTLLFKALLKDNLKKINVPSQIYKNGHFIDFPLSPYGLYKFLGFKDFFREGCVILFNQFLDSSISDNFHDYAVRRFGKKISHLFLLDYTKKLWGLDTKSLSVSISGNRLKGLSIYTLFLETIFGNKIKTKHLDGSFYYPDYGIGSIFEKLIAKCNSDNLHLKAPVTQINHNNQRINSLVINNSKTVSVDQLISSMPLGLLLNILNPSPPKYIMDIIQSIRFRNIILVCFFLNKDSVNKNGSMYFPDKKYPFTRIYEPKNRSSLMSPKNKTSLIVEIPCQSSDDIWKKKSPQLINKVQTQLVDLNFFTQKDVIDTCIFPISHAYPILDVGFESKVKDIFMYLNEIKNLHFCGRNSMFEYSHIHDHIKNADILMSKLK